MKRVVMAGYAAALCLAWVAPVSAEDEPPPAADPVEELVCRYETPTGSHTRVKVCRTQAQIKAAEDSTQRVMDKARAKGNQLNASGG